ncbi:unnamed protein product [Musa acuminata subsp. burmannicoides]
MRKKKRAWGRGSVHHRSVGSGSSDDRIRWIKGEVGDEACSEVGSWFAGDILGQPGAPVELNEVAMYREGVASSESLVEYSYGKVEEGGVEDRGGGEQDPVVGRVAGVGLTRAEDAYGSGDSYGVIERRFSVAG